MLHYRLPCQMIKANCGENGSFTLSKVFHLLNELVLEIAIGAGGNEGHPVNIHTLVGPGAELSIFNHMVSKELFKRDISKKSDMLS